MTFYRRTNLTSSYTDGVVGGGWEGEDYRFPTTFLDPLNNLFPRVLSLAPRKNPGVNLIKLLQVSFTSVAIVFRLLNNGYSCKLQM